MLGWQLRRTVRSVTQRALEILSMVAGHLEALLVGLHELQVGGVRAISRASHLLQQRFFIDRQAWRLLVSWRLMILNGILADANLVGVLHHAGAGVGLVQLLRAVLLALRVRVRRLHRLVPLPCDQLLLFLGALPVNLSQAAVLLEL